MLFATIFTALLVSAKITGLATLWIVAFLVSIGWCAWTVNEVVNDIISTYRRKKLLKKMVK